MNKGKIISLIFIYLMFVNVSVAQVSDEIDDGIKTSLIAKYGNVALIGSLIDVNIEKNKYQQWSFPITDPYETLKDCYLFGADTETGGLVGIYKNNRLIWDSGPIIDLFNSNINIQILGTTDLNKDGNVEILAAWNYGVTGFIQNIWVFSWNGSNGQLLNESLPGRNGNTLKSAIWSYDYITDILDVNGDGIFEIKGVDRKHTNSAKIYSWDGQKYDDYGITAPQYTPMNLLIADVQCKVNKSQYGLLYNYSVQNAITSQQSIRIFAVDRISEKTFANSSSPNMKWRQYYPNGLLGWKVSNDLHKFPFDYLLPGVKRKNFKEETDANIIIICNLKN